MKLRPGRLTNSKIRVLVGLVLVALIVAHFAGRTEAVRTPSEYAVAVDGKIVGQTSEGVVNELERLARTDHLALLENCARHYDQNYRDYTCTLVKQERLGGTIAAEQTIEVTFLDKPFSVGMKWVVNAPRGDRVLYIEGKYGNQMLVRPTGAIARALVPTALRKPDGEDALKSTLRPVNMFGFRRGLDSLIEIYRLARDRHECREEFGGYAEVAGRNALVLVRYLPNRPEYPAALTKVYIDTETLLPIMIEGFGWNNDDFLCRYLYKDVKLNLGLSPESFAPKAFDLAEPK